VNYAAARGVYSVAEVTSWRLGALMLVAIVGLVAGCGDRGDGAEVPEVTAPYTGPASVLAPSQLSHPTVPEPAVPEACDAADIDVVAGPGAPPDSDVVVTFRNNGAHDCEVDLGTTWALAHSVEPSVRLAPSAAAELWGSLADPECTGGAAPWELTVNGVALTVELPGDGPCVVVPVAFFPT